MGRDGMLSFAELPVSSSSTDPSLPLDSASPARQRQSLTLETAPSCLSLTQRSHFKLCPVLLEPDLGARARQPVFGRLRRPCPPTSPRAPDHGTRLQRLRRNQGRVSIFSALKLIASSLDACADSRCLRGIPRSQPRPIPRDRL